MLGLYVERVEQCGKALYKCYLLLLLSLLLMLHGKYEKIIVAEQKMFVNESANLHIVPHP